MNAIDYFRANPAALVSALHPLNLQDAVMLALDAIDHPIAKGLGVSCDARDFRAAVDAAILERDADGPDLFKTVSRFAGLRPIEQEPSG